MTARDNLAHLFVLVGILLIMWMCDASVLFMSVTVLVTSMMLVLKHYSQDDRKENDSE